MYKIALYKKLKNLGGGTDVIGFCKSHKNEDFFEKLVSFDIAVEPKKGLNLKLGEYFYQISMSYYDLDTSTFMCLVNVTHA